MVKDDTEVSTLLQALKTRRSMWDSTLWPEISKYFRPDRNNWTSTPKVDIDDNLYDGTGVQVVSLAADGVAGYLCNYAVPWLDLQPPEDIADPSLADAVNKTLVAWKKHLYRTFARSNFYGQSVEMLLDGWSIGTATMIIKNNPAKGRPSYHCIHPKQVYIAEDAYKEVETVVREFKLSARALVEMFPEKVPQEVKDKEAKAPYEELDVVHAVFPATKDELGRGFRSVYILNSIGNPRAEGGKTILEAKNVYQNPYIVWRHSTNSDEEYGRTPAYNLLSEVYTLQQIARTKLIAAQKTIDPPMWINTQAQELLDMNPGAHNFLQTQGGIPPQALHTVGQFPFALEEYQHYKQIIIEAYRADFFKMLQQAPAGMTATEVLEKQGEKAATLSTNTGRTQHEFLTPAIDKTLWIEHEAGRLPNPEGLPSEVIKQLIADKRVEYIGMLPLLQKRYSSNQQLQQTLALVGTTAQIFGPASLQVYKPEAFQRRVAKDNGVDAELLHTESELQKIKQAQAQAQAAQEQKAMELELMKNADKLNQPIQPQSPLANLGRAASTMRGSA